MTAAYAAFRRAPMPQQLAQRLQVVSLPAPTRGLILNENETYIQPGAALVLDNWKPTTRSIALRGGCIKWCDLHALDAVVPPFNSSLRKPVVSMFQYIGSANQRMFAAQTTKLFDVTANTPTLVKSGQLSGNYVASQLANQGGEFMIALNDAGDYPLRYNGTAWATLNGTPPATWLNGTAYAVNARALDTTDHSYWKNTFAHTSAASGAFSADRTAHPTYWVADVAPDNMPWITGPAGSLIEGGHNLTYVWKYRNRFFFIEGGTMNAWYLPLNAVGGLLQMIPLAGAATKGGKLLCGFSWSLDAGDGTDDKCVFATDQGELLIFTGGDPSTAANWQQEGRYAASPMLGMNAHQAIGGDVLLATVDGLIPVSACITKDTAQLELATISRAIKPMWRIEAATKRNLPWTMCKWDEYGGLFIAVPGGNPGNQHCLGINIATGAWCRFTWDVMCFARLRADMFFGDQRGIVMQADRTGYDDGLPYIATMVGGWEMFSSQAATMVWRQARAHFSSRAGEAFQPQLSATTDYVIVIPPPPVPGDDPGTLDVWDQGLWATTPPAPEPTFQAKWDADVPQIPVVRNTGWVSIGYTGFSHAPIVQVTVAQAAIPEVELISIAATYEPCGVNV